MITDTIYVTGLTDSGDLLCGGIWRLYRQEGFPVDLSVLILREKGVLPDLCEMMAEASMHSELPQLEKQCPELFTPEAKLKFMALLEREGYPQEDYTVAAERILLDKRLNGIAPSQYGKMVLVQSELKRFR